MKKRRQYVLEEVASWHTVSAFREERAEALWNMYRRAQLLQERDDINRSWDHKISQAERKGREE